MDGVFKLFVSAIILFAVLLLVFNYFTPLISQPADLMQEITKGFTLSKANEGMLSGEEKPLFFKKGQSVNAKNFEDNSTLAVFECNDSSLCCVDDSQCTNAFRIDTLQRTVTVAKDSTAKVFYRCDYDRRLFVCKAFFGVKPAQVEITELTVPKTINLSANRSLNIQAKIKDSSEISSKGKLSVKLQAFDSTDSNPAKQPLAEKLFEIAKIQGLESRTENFQFPLSGPGKLDIIVKIGSEDAGSSTKTAKVTASGEIQTDCAAVSKQAPEVYSPAGSITELQGKCVSRASCDKCNTSFECRQAWLSRDAIVVSAGNDYAYVVEPDNSCS